GSIGESTKDLTIDVRSLANGRLYATASANIYITEFTGALNVLRATAGTGDVRLTVPDTADSGQDLNLLASGNTLVDTSTTLSGRIWAGGSVLLQVGDNVTTAAGSAIVAGDAVTILGDYGNADSGTGTTMPLAGVIASDAGIDASGNVTPASPAHQASTSGT